jgi:hypothetical protein
MYLRFTDHHLDIQPGALLGGPTGRGDDLHRHFRVSALHRGCRRRGDVGREAVGRRNPHHTFEGPLTAVVDGQ